MQCGTGTINTSFRCIQQEGKHQISSVLALCEGNPPTESVSMAWHHHGYWPTWHGLYNHWCNESYITEHRRWYFNFYHLNIRTYITRQTAKCNYLSMPGIAASSAHVPQYIWRLYTRECARIRTKISRFQFEFCGPNSEQRRINVLLWLKPDSDEMRITSGTRYDGELMRKVC